MSDVQSDGWNESFVDEESGMSLAEMLRVLRSNLLLLILAPLAAGVLALGIASLIAPTFTASTTMLPPQQAQSISASALASLGPLAALAGGGAGANSPGDRYIALMQSVTLSDRIIDQFKLMDVYESKLRVDARKSLAANVRMSLGKKDGLITVDVDDKDPRRASDIANRYVDELRRITGNLAVTEAQQRRVFFERLLQQSRDNLTAAQQALQSSGFNSGALKAEPKAAADTYARLRAEATSAEVRLNILRGTLSDDTPEVRQQQAALSALRSQLARVEQPAESNGGVDYVGKYREFKYQETLFDLYARQFEIARVDESREGALIQVVDVATPPERKSKPQRAFIALVTTAVALATLVVFVFLRHSLRSSRLNAGNSIKTASA